MDVSSFETWEDGRGKSFGSTQDLRVQHCSRVKHSSNGVVHRESSDLETSALTVPDPLLDYRAIRGFCREVKTSAE